MNKLRKLFTAFLGGCNETVDAAIDSQGIRILNQEIRESESAIREAENELVTIVGKRKLSEKNISALDEKIEEMEQNARNAHEKGSTELAMECAQEVAKLIQQRDSEKEVFTAFSNAEKKNRDIVSQARETVKKLKQQADLVKATESVQKAQAATHTSVVGASSKTSTALDSLERIKKRQDEDAAKFEAQAEISAEATGSGLEARLAEAGIGGTNSAEDELSRILGKTKK